MAKKTSRITVRLTPEQHAQLKAEAQRRDRSEHWLARHYIDKGLNARPRPKNRPQ